MNLMRNVTWALLLGASALAGPNLPAQGLAALRQAFGTLGRRA